MLDGTDQVGRAEGVVDHQGQAVLVGDGRDGVDIRNIAVGIAQGFQIDGPGVFLNGAFHLAQVMGIHKGGGDAILGQGVAQQVEAAAIDGFLRHDMPAIGSQGFNGVGDCCRPGSHRQRRAAALQRCQALFQHLLGGVGQPAVNVPRVRQPETVRRVLAAVEYI